MAYCRVDAAPTKYALYATSAPFGTAPAHPTLLSTGLPPDAPASDDFAPTVVAQADGSWVVAFTHGPHDPRDGDTQQVYVRAYNPDLTPRGAPVLASDARGASDPRLLFTGDHHLLAMAVGHGSHRAVVVRNVRCISRPVGEH